MSLLDLMRPDRDPSDAQTRVYGAVTAIVQDIKDPLNQGRVKVNYPWLAEASQTIKVSGDDKPAHSYWARLALPVAGRDRGTWLLPQIGDEVAVVFEHGDMNRPIVVGALWNKEDLPPHEVPKDGKGDVYAFKSKSGHTVTINDSDDKPGIEIVDSKKNCIKIDTKNGAMEIKVSGDLKIDAGGSITITAKKGIKLEASQDITADAQGSLKATANGSGAFEAKGPVKVKGANASVEGTGQAELKAAMVSVNGSGITEVKGGLVKIN